MITEKKDLDATCFHNTKTPGIENVSHRSGNKGISGST